MDNDEQVSVGDAVQSWVDEARGVIDARAQVRLAASKATNLLQQRLVRAVGAGGVGWQFLPIDDETFQAVRSVAALSVLPEIPADVQAGLDRLVTEVAEASDDLRRGSGFGRLLLFGGTRDKANKAAQFLPEYRDWFVASGLRGAINSVRPVDDLRVRGLVPGDCLAPWVGLNKGLPARGENAVVKAAVSFAGLPHAAAVVRGAEAKEAGRRAQALAAGNEVRRTETDRMLSEMAVDRLREASRDQIRVGVLTENGITDVLAVLQYEDVLEEFDGIGPMSATRIRAAARTLRHNTFEEMPIRIDINHRTPALTTFLQRLRDWDAIRRADCRPDALLRAAELAPIAAVVNPAVTHAVLVPAASSSAPEFDDAVRTVVAAAVAIEQATAVAQTGDPWDDFISRPADYFALLNELGFIAEDEEKSQGDLPAEIVEAIREFELKPDHLVASLRGYQSFAARFALVQGKVIIGDEMGLGKTVESIAVLAHLRAKGEHHFLVISPAAVVTNWVQEVSRKSKLGAHRLHGPDRMHAAKTWFRSGGVAVTTFETLPWLIGSVELPAVSCVVVDEAHYVKNPESLRSKRTAQMIDSSKRAILLTGTPLENRLDEFRNLVRYIRPDLIVDADEFSPSKFRRQVAPAYLRRNQEDVLTELPELVEVVEWVAMSGADLAEYRAAVNARNFMGMRQAALKRGVESAKMHRLIELVAEAEVNGRRVIVFSHFLDVVKDVCDLLPGRVFGPLTGSVAASKRQTIVDDFSEAKGGAVLVAQIVAGGVGLNIQAASVVVICEPQLKPTTEWQAIARAHRMGQLETVQVHRLVSEEGVDKRVREILARKREMFENFARESDTAASAPEAYDITDAELAREIIDEERQRLFGQKPNGELPLAPVGGNADAPAHDAVRPQRAAAKVPAPSAARVGDRKASPRRGEVSAESSATDPSRPSPVISVVPPNPQQSARPLSPYPHFRGPLPGIAASSANEIAANVVQIVSTEGPVTGWRIHRVYEECVASRRSSDELSRLVNRAISDAGRQGLIVSENPLGQSGNKPLTFRLPDQLPAPARELGPRTIDVVPISEVAEYCRIVLSGQSDLPEDEIVGRVAALIGKRQLPGALHRAVRAARQMHQT